MCKYVMIQFDTCCGKRIVEVASFIEFNPCRDRVV